MKIENWFWISLPRGVCIVSLNKHERIKAVSTVSIVIIAL